MGIYQNPNKRRGIVAVRAESPSGLKPLVEELNKAFADFRKENDARLVEVEKGLSDVVTAEKVDRINAHISSLQDKLDETLKKVDAMEIGGTGADPEAMAKLEKDARIFLAGMKGVDVERVTGEDVEAYRAYANAYPSWLRRGEQAMRSQDVQASMSVGSDADGGYWVPTQQQSRIIERMFETSPMRQMASVISITTDSVEWPNDTNDATSGGWVGETETRPETDTPQVGSQTIYVREQYAMPIVTQKLLDMATIDVEGWLNRKIADKLARTENTAFVNGTGVASPRGFLDYKSTAVTTADASRAWGLLQYIVTGASAGLPSISGVPGATDADKIWDVIAALKPMYRAGAVWTMNRATEAFFRKMKDGDGNYLVGPITGAAQGFQLGGFPIATAEDMPNVGADSFSAAFGNFEEGYQIVDGRGLRILRDPYTTKGKVKFYTTKWTGGDVLNFDAIKLLKFGTS